MLDTPIKERYGAFISYSQHDKRWAIWLQRRLERYRVPDVPGVRDRRMGRIFRDRSELASGDSLDEALHDALAASAALVVVCSPQSARSRWVDAEIRRFRELRPGARVLALVVSGQPHAADPEQECLPPALLAGGNEPLAADARPEGDGRNEAWLKIAAGLLGVGFDALYRRELRRRNRVAATVAGLSLAGIVITTTLAAMAIRARDEAERQSLRAERVKDFVVSVFREQDPLSRSTAAARSPQQMVSDAAKRMDSELGSEPEVRADLLHDLGTIERHLGALSDSESLLERAVQERTGLYGANSPEAAQSQIQLARVRVDQARYTDAEQLARSGLAVLAAQASPDPIALARGKLALAQSISFGKGAPPEAEKLFSEALASFEQHLGAEAPDSIAALFQLAQMYNQARQLDKAELQARALVQRCRRQYGDPSAPLGNALALLGDVLATGGKQEESIAALTQGAAQLRSQLGNRNPSLANTLSHLAIQLRSAGRLEEAAAAYIQAEQALSEGDDSNRADILRGRGRLALLLGRPEQAEALLREAYALRRKASGDSNGFTWYFASEWGRALAALGRLAQAEAIQRQALEQLQKIMGPEAYQNALLADVLADTLERMPARRAEAEQLRRDALRRVEARYPQGSKQWADYALGLACNLRMANNLSADSEGLTLIAQIVTALRKQAGAETDEKLVTALLEQGWFLERRGRSDEARRSVREAQDILSRLKEPNPDQVAAARTQAKSLERGRR